MKVSARNSEQNPAVQVVELDGPLHILNADELKEQLQSIASGTAQIALNMSKVTRLDSSGIGVLIQAKTQVRDSGGNMVMFGTNDEVVSVLTMAGLKVFFNLQDSESEAVEYLGRHAGDAD